MWWGRRCSSTAFSAGFTDAGGEIVLQLAPAIHSITVTSGGITSSPFEVTVAEGDSVTLEAEFDADGTLTIEQDIDHDGEYDDDDDLQNEDDRDDDAEDEDDGDEGDDGDDDDDDQDDDTDEDEDEDEDDEAGAGGHTDGTVVTQ